MPQAMLNSYRGREGQDKKKGKGGSGKRGKEQPEVKVYQSLLKSFPLSAQFVSEGGNALPDYPSRSISLSFDILGNAMSKNISLKTTFKLPAPRKRHTADLDFYPGIEDHLVDFNFERVMEQDIEGEKRLCGFLLTWKTQGGVGCGVKFRHDSLSPQAQDCLNQLERFSADSDLSDEVNSSLNTIKIHLITDDIKKDDLAKLEDILQSLRSTTNAKNPWFAYLDEDGRPNCDFSSMPSVESIKAVHHGWTQFPASDYFIGPEEAQIRLGYGAKQEYEFDVEMLEQRRRNLRDRRKRGQQDGGEDESRVGTVSNSIVRRQLLALARLCDKSRNVLGRKFWPVLLNREMTDMPRSDPTESLGLDEAEIDLAMMAIKNALDWSQEQISGLNLARELTGRLGLLRGPPGSGKTQLLIAITAFYAMIGLHVILFTTSTSSAENLSTGLKSFLKELRRPPHNDPLYVNPIGLYYSSPDYHRLARRYYNGRYQDAQDEIELYDAEVVVSTLDNRMIDPLLEEFGIYSKGIMIIHDDANMEVESDTWMTIFGLNERAKVQGIILAGDASEWHTDMHSRNSHMNAFAAQMSLSLFDRLLHRGFPAVTLKQQHRMTPQLSRLPILRQYKGRLTNSPETSSRVANSQWIDFYRSWLGAPQRKTETDLTVTLVNVSNGRGEKAMSKSKMNYENVKVVLDLCIDNYKKNGIDPGGVVILTPYREQVALYEKAIELEKESHELPDDAFPTPYTVDGFRGKESSVVILDLVLSDASDKYELGMVGDEYRSVLGSTRARDFLIIVVNMSFCSHGPPSDSDYLFLMRYLGISSDDEATKKKDNEPQKLPYFHNYANILKGEGKVYEKQAQGHAKYVVEFKGGRSRGLHEGGTWVREDWKRAEVVTGGEYANPQHEQDEKDRKMVSRSQDRN